MRLKDLQQAYDKKLTEQLLAPFQGHTRLEASIRYSLENAGKHLRVYFILALMKAFGVDEAKGLPAGIAVEYIHTYSLIHDDLPAMDDDDYRRGVLSNHRAFDEATAILAGDALLTAAFEYLSATDLYSDRTKIKLMTLLSQAAGYQGMVSGQSLDLEAEGTDISLEAVEVMYQRKTGALLSYSIKAGALLSAVESEGQKLLNNFAKHYGLAYQIHNDLQEEVWTDKKRGKISHSDKLLQKNTFPAHLGIPGAKSYLEKCVQAAKENLASLEGIYETRNFELLYDFLHYLKI